MAATKSCFHGYEVWACKTCRRSARRLQKQRRQRAHVIADAEAKLARGEPLICRACSEPQSGSVALVGHHQTAHH